MASMSTRRFAYALGLGLLSSLTTACGSGESGSAPELSDADRAAMDGEVATLQQKLGEQTCAATQRDAVIDVAAGGILGVGSNDALYDHPTCRDAYIVDITHFTEPHSIWAQGEGPAGLDPFGCLFTFAAATLYRKDGANYVKVGEGSAVGTYPWPGSSGWQCSVKVDFGVQQPGEYRVAVGAAQFLGTKKRAGVIVTN
jgi:hypothetical protein